MPLTINLNQLAPLLETEKQLTKQELLSRIKPAIDTGKESYRLFCQFIEQIQFFNITKDRLGQVIIS